jgi:acetoacetate decarboxylase
MGFEFSPDKMYMMPVLFGPSVTPRQRYDGKRWIHDGPIRKESHIIVYESNPSQLESLLPTGFGLYSPHVVIDLSMLRNIPWLAGKGYNLFKVQIPVTYDAPEGKMNGHLLTVIWENHTDPIITGREQLGYSKIYAEIQDVKRNGKIATSSLSSWGFEFLKMEIDFSAEPPDKDELFSTITPPGNAGLFHYKYIPRTGEGFKKADFEGVVLGPSEWKMPDDLDTSKYPKDDVIMELGRGKIQWNHPRWEDMPTQHHIVDTLSNFECVRYVGALRSVSYSSNDLFDQRILKNETNLSELDSEN